MYIQKANQLFQQQKYEDALLLYEKIAQAEPALAKYLDLNIKLTKHKISNNPLESTNCDILVTIWLSNDEPIHDIIKNSIKLLNEKCITSKLFAPAPLLKSIYNDNIFTEIQPASLYLSMSFIPNGIDLPRSFIETNQQLIDYLWSREEQWLIGNKADQSDNLCYDNFIRGIRYWTQTIVQQSPKLMLIWGSSSPVSLFLIELCNSLSIKYQILERGLIPGTLIVDDNKQFATSYASHLHSSTFFDQSSSKNCICLLNEYLDKSDVIPYKDFNHASSEHLFKSDQTIILFIGSNDLGSGIALQDSNYQTYNDSEYQSSWEVASDLAASLPFLNNNSVLYIKPHPADKSDFYSLENENVKVLSTNDLHELIEKSTICCTLETTAIAICLLKNKPVITFSSTDISNTGISFEVYRRSELISQIRNALLQTDFSQITANVNKYFEFALNYRLYFETKNSKFGSTPSSLADRLFMIIAKQYRKHALAFKSDLDTVISPIFFQVDKFNLQNAPPVDIVIPLYDGYELSRSCIEYAINAVSSCFNYNIILVNDCSPNHQLTQYLDSLRLSEMQNIHVHTNPVNTGFSGAVNIGISLSRPNADILLLNSDALISNYTLSSLQMAAYSDPKIGTVCPLSTDGGLLTVPINISHESVIKQEKLDKINLDLLGKDNIHCVVLPVNHGACLYIKKSALQLVGLFNEFIFGRGYSEEIDFCLRLRLHGLHNVGCCFSFVQHVGGVSFGEDTNPLKVKNRKIIQEKYPLYFDEVKRFLPSLQKEPLFCRLSTTIKASLDL